MWTADEPQILGSFAKVDVLKDSISGGKYQRDIHMPCTIGTVDRGAQWVERTPLWREGQAEAAQEKETL